MNEKQLAAAASRNHLSIFLRRVFKEVRPGDDYLHSWHVDAICHAAEQVLSGKIRYLVITVPPRHLKSTIISVALPAFILGRDRTRRIVAASYSKDLAIQFSNETRQVMKSAWYRRLFPNTRISRSKDTQEDFRTLENGGRMATSVEAALTGFGGNILILDDIMSAQDAASPLRRQASLDWFRHTARSRLDNPKTDAIIVVQQRLHEEDLPGVLIEEGWTHLDLPAIAEEEAIIPLGMGRTKVRAVGEVLHPARLSMEDLDQIRHDVGNTVFAAQFQQRPGPAGGDIVKWAWFKRFKDLTVCMDDAVIQSWDFAFSVEEYSDFSVCLTFRYRNGELHLLDVYREKLDTPTLQRKVIEHVNKWNASRVLLEASGINKPFCNMLHRTDKRFFFFTVQCDKVTRLAAYANLIEQGRMLLPEDAPWLKAFKQELEYFPNGKYKDQVDALSQALRWLAEFSNPPKSRVTPIYKNERIHVRLF